MLIYWSIRPTVRHYNYTILINNIIQPGCKCIVRDLLSCCWLVAIILFLENRSFGCLKFPWVSFLCHALLDALSVFSCCSHVSVYCHLFSSCLNLLCRFTLATLSHLMWFKNRFSFLLWSIKVARLSWISSDSQLLLWLL